jgi:hypothetical protein
VVLCTKAKVVLQLALIMALYDFRLRFNFPDAYQIAMSNLLKRFYASKAKERLLSSPTTTSEAKYRIQLISSANHLNFKEVRLWKKSSL